MGEIDITKLKCTVKMMLASKEVLDITGLCIAVAWGDEKDSIAQKAEITLANIKIKQGYLSDLIELCTQVYIYVNKKEYFRGTVWDWNYVSGLEKELSFTAYDKMIYLTQSKENAYYSSGKSTQFLKKIFFILRMKNRSSLYQKHFSCVSFRNCYVKMLLNNKEIH